VPVTPVLLPTAMVLMLAPSAVLAAPVWLALVSPLLVPALAPSARGACMMKLFVIPSMTPPGVEHRGSSFFWAD
jgi:hypothetical protein